MIEIPEGIHEKYRYNPSQLRTELIEHNLMPRSSILMGIGIIGIVIGFASWYDFIPDPLVNQISLHENAFLIGVPCLIMGYLPHLALLLSIVVIGIIVAISFLLFPESSNSILGVPYSFWSIIGIILFLLLILFFDVKNTTRRLKQKIATEVDQYLDEVRTGIRDKYK